MGQPFASLPSGSPAYLAEHQSSTAALKALNRTSIDIVGFINNVTAGLGDGMVYTWGEMLAVDASYYFTPATAPAPTPFAASWLYNSRHRRK